MAKRILLITGIALALISMLCIGLVVGVTVAPVQARIGQALERVFSRDRAEVRIAPRIFRQDGELKANRVLGARIVEVVEGSPAEKAGLSAGEIIQAVDGEALGAGNNLAERISARQPGDTVNLTLLQPDGETREVAVELGENPDQEGAAWLGIQYATPLPNSDRMPFRPGRPNLPDQLQPDYERGIPFPPGKLRGGALIREVVENSPADEAGLRFGQVVEAVDGKELTSSKDLTDLLSAHKPGDKLSLTVFDPRSLETAEIEVTLGENPEKAGVGWMGIRFDFLNIRFHSDSLPEG